LRKVKETGDPPEESVVQAQRGQIKGLRGGVLKYAAQEILKTDPPEADESAIYGWKLIKLLFQKFL
jgi:hypothetical protein